MSGKVMSVEAAVELVGDGDTVAITAAGMVGYPEYLARGLEARFLKTASPRGLTVVAAGGHGVQDERGDSRFGRPGFLKRYVSTHPITVPSIGALMAKNEVEGYAVPQGVMNQLYRACAAGQPGILTKIGIGTYIDPRQDGGKLNAAAAEDLVELMEIDGEEWLFFKTFPVDVALIRGTTADEDGNVTIEREALRLEILEAALAARAGGGRVIVQVQRVRQSGSLKAREVAVPGELVDAVVVVDDIARNHRQTDKVVYSPYLSGEQKRPGITAARHGAALTPEDVICRRAVQELFPGAIVNIGFGVGAGVGPVAEAEGILDDITFTLEMGTLGGVPTPADDFGAACNATAYMAPSSMFDFYHGGGLDITFLGTAQVDRYGNVNVSRFGNRLTGQGGFIDISQSTPKVVFVTCFSARGFRASVEDARLHIVREGEVPKFVSEVDQITFNGPLAVQSGQEVIYITERAVFRLTKEGLVLTEIAPGVDLERDVLGGMGFVPVVSPRLRVMDGRIFAPGRMGCFD